MAKAKKGNGRKKGATGRKRKQKKAGSGAGRGTGLRNWNTIRSEVKSHLEETGETFTLKELNAYASELYSEHKDNIGPALQNIDLLVEGYFDEEFPPLIPSFDFWNLEFELGYVAHNAHIIVDNNGFTPHYFDGTAADFLVNHVQEFVAAINRFIRDIGRKDKENYFLYLRFDGVYEGEDFIYYLLVPEEEAGMTEEQFKAILGAKGYDLSKLTIKPQVEGLEVVAAPGEPVVTKKPDVVSAEDTVKVAKAKAEVIRAEAEKVKAEAELLGAKEKLLARIEGLYDKGLITKQDFKLQYGKLMG